MMADWPPRSDDGLHGATFEWDAENTAVHCICGFYRCAESHDVAEREYLNHVDLARGWPTLMDIPDYASEVYDNQGRKWEREGDDWATYGSFIQRWSTAVTDLSGWGPFKPPARLT